MTVGRNQAMKEDKIVALYVRVSTGYQVDKDSLPFQKKELKAYCEHILHKTNYEIFEDAGKSGKNTDRPGYQRMIKKIRAGQVSHVVVYKIDRISRNLVDFSLMYDEFKKYYVTFISLNEQFDTSSAIGEAVLKIILVFAELERKLTSERVTDVMIGRALEKKWNGARMPFGWKWNPKTEFPEHDPEEADAARALYEQYDQLHSTSKLRDYCYDHNIATKRGGRWNTSSLAVYLRNPMNKGDYRYNYRNSARGRKKPEDQVIYVPGVFPPLVDPELWDRVNTTLDHNNEVKRMSGRSRQDKRIHVFAGLLRCADCGAGMQAASTDKQRANGFRPSLYVCTSRRTYRACSAPYASEVIVGPFVFQYIANIIQATKNRKKIASAAELESALLRGNAFQGVRCINPEDLNVILQAIRSPAAVSGSSSYIPAPIKEEPRPDLTELRKEEQKYSRALERLKNAFLFDDTAIPENEYLSTRSELTEKLTQVRNKIADAEEDSFEHVSKLSFVNSASSFLVSCKIQSGEEIDYQTLAASVDPKVLKDFVNLVLDHVTVKKARPSEIVFKNGLRNRFVWNE